MMARPAVRDPVSIAAAVLLLAGLAGCADRPAAVTDYARELGRVTSDIERLRDQGDGLQLLRQYYTKASLTTDFGDLAAVEHEIDQAIAAMGPREPLVLAKASVAMKLHRLDEARHTLDGLPSLGANAAGRALRADIALQQGDYAGALDGLLAAVRERPSWENLARLAYYRAMTGEPEQADRLYVQAQELLTAKEMRHYAWLELQRGVIDLNAGHYPAALAHYRHADRAYSGYWLIEEHIAEVLALMGRIDESAAIYERVVRATGKPDLAAAYARVIATRDPRRAAELEQQADQAFARQMALYPRAAVGHYLRYLIDAEADRTRLVWLARFNVAARPNADAKLLLAQACAKAGRFGEARSLVAEIERSPWRPRGLAALQEALRHKT